MPASCCCPAAETLTVPTCMTWHSTAQLGSIARSARRCALPGDAVARVHLPCAELQSRCVSRKMPPSRGVSLHALLLHPMAFALVADESRVLLPDPDAARCRRARSTDGAHLLAGQHLGPLVDKQRRSIDGMQVMQQVLKKLRRSVEMRVGHVGSWLGWLCNVCLSANLRRGSMTLLMTLKTLPAQLHSFLQDIVLRSKVFCKLQEGLLRYLECLELCGAWRLSAARGFSGRHADRQDHSITGSAITSCAKRQG